MTTSPDMDLVKAAQAALDAALASLSTASANAISADNAVNVASAALAVVVASAAAGTPVNPAREQAALATAQQAAVFAHSVLEYAQQQATAAQDALRNSHALAYGPVFAAGKALRLAAAAAADAARSALEAAGRDLEAGAVMIGTARSYGFGTDVETSWLLPNPTAAQETAFWAGLS